MSAVTARPLGADEPATEVPVATPVFRYGLKKGLLASPTTDTRLVIGPRGAPPTVDAPLASVATVSGFLLVEVADVRPGVRYDGDIVQAGQRAPLFRDAELYRLAVDDPTCRALPPLLPEEAGPGEA